MDNVKTMNKGKAFQQLRDQCNGIIPAPTQQSNDNNIGDKVLGQRLGRVLETIGRADQRGVGNEEIAYSVYKFADETVSKSCDPSNLQARNEKDTCGQNIFTRTSLTLLDTPW